MLTLSSLLLMTPLFGVHPKIQLMLMTTSTDATPQNGNHSIMPTRPVKFSVGEIFRIKVENFDSYDMT